MKKEVSRCVELLDAGKVILYPTDTVWGIGCDATNEAAVRRIFEIKERRESKSLLVLLDSLEHVSKYVERIPLIAWDLVPTSGRPTTFIYPNAHNLPPIMVADDGTIAIRIVQSGFCHQLIKALGRPLVSTSANISGTPSPAIFSEIAPTVRQRVDHIVPESFASSTDLKPSRIIRLIDDSNFSVVRE